MDYSSSLNVLEDLIKLNYIIIQIISTNNIIFSERCFLKYYG